MKNKKKIILITIFFILFLMILIYFINYRCDFTGSWVRNIDLDEETIYFGKSGHFSYYTTEGNAVDDYDLCYLYRYNKKTKEIKLICDKDFDGIKKLKVINRDSKKLKISFDGDIKVFEKGK